MFNNTKKLSADCEGVRKFRDAEQLWFWFLSCRQKDALIGRTRTLVCNPYPCEAIDVETLITRLFLSGKIKAEQLEVLKEFGDRKRTPNQHMWAENKKASLWSGAMREITVAAREKRWIE
ncbi:MAG: hypothetical protein FWE50_03410 [Alphaproteobacteria bacterium]|nr:hypothetical protein [Alphaproteobacteria bacterium]